MASGYGQTQGSGNPGFNVVPGTYGNAPQGQSNMGQSNMGQSNMNSAFQGGPNTTMGHGQQDVHSQINSAVDSLGAPPTGQAVPQTKQRLFGRTQGVHQMLGGGHWADVLLWRKWQISVGILGVATVMWILFEWSGYTLLTLLSNTALIVVAAVFIWAQASHFLNRAPPPLPEFQLTEEHVQWAAGNLRTETNKALAVAHNVALGKDYKQFALVILGLYLVAQIGSWFNTLTLVFLGVLLLFTIPLFYERNEDKVDAQLMKAMDEIHRLWVIAEEKIRGLMHKVPSQVNKVQNSVQNKKVQ